MGFMSTTMYVTHVHRTIMCISFVCRCSFISGLKLEKDFYNVQKDRFNISKVPDIYDSIKYDLLHNKNILQYPHTEDLYVCSKALADLVVPQVNCLFLFIVL
jgi:inositol-hexakisphosphate/diphosphoinositol-pentakisphosphate 1-kinase